jgi:uncharacterized MAPEG superfamily protein
MTVASWCVLAAGFLPYVMTAIAKAGANIDNRAPRDSAQRYEGYRKRAHAAQLNGFEAFPLFAAAVIIADMNHAPRHTLDILAAGFVAARVLYSGAYVADLPSLRSLVWGVGLVLVLAIFSLPLWG